MHPAPEGPKGWVKRYFSCSTFAEKKVAHSNELSSPAKRTLSSVIHLYKALKGKMLSVHWVWLQIALCKQAHLILPTSYYLGLIHRTSTVTSNICTWRWYNVKDLKWTTNTIDCLMVLGWRFDPKHGVNKLQGFSPECIYNSCFVVSP